MKMQPRHVIVIVALIVAAALGGTTLYQLVYPGPSCGAPLGTSKVLRSQLSPVTFGAVTEFALPSPLRDPNAPLVAPDGSVWFAEQSVPGLAHFFPGNGTLVEYAWPYSYPTASSSGVLCGTKTEIWGVALFDNKVWASDTTGNRLVSMSPSGGSFTTTKLPTNESYPYTLTVAPDGSLWFPELYSAKIGEIGSNGSLRELTVPGGAKAVPSDITFANATRGYYADAGLSGASLGGVYSFDTKTFSPALVGNRRLSLPTGIALTKDSLWAALHGSSSLASYNFTSRDWSFFPTTYVNYVGTTLPYFVRANGSSVWFNEHYGNKLGRIDPMDGSLAEYSLSNPPAQNGSAIGNALTFAVGKDKAWFAEWTGNTIGFVDASFKPGFSLAIQGNRTVALNRGGTFALKVTLMGRASNLSLRFADSESFSSRPGNLTFSAPQSVKAVNGQTQLDVSISASASMAPGTYTALVTVTDGLTYVSSLVKVVVVVA